MTRTDAAVRLRRVIPAPPHEVYRAWLDPDILRRWLAPGELQVTRIEVDERVGGVFRVWQGSGDHELGGFECQLVELVADARLVFDWAFVGPARTEGPTYDSRLTLTFGATTDGHTELTLVHEHLGALRADMPDVAEQVGPGWEDVLDKLTTALLGRA
jgi:uncharacterized protein YndB with AHSA1/START domain